MPISEKSRATRELTRRKYVRTNRPALWDRERRLKVSPMRRSILMRPSLARRREEERQKTLAEIRRERDPEKLKAKIEQAQKQGIDTAAINKDLERSKKMEKAKNRLIEQINRLKSREVSASVKESIQQLHIGQVSGAVHQLAENGREGSVGNDLASTEAAVAREMKTLERESGRHASSVIQRILRDSVPADSINAEKRQDKGDQNLEGRQTQKSTFQQMVEKKMRERKLRNAA